MDRTFQDVRGEGVKKEFSLNQRRDLITMKKFQEKMCGDHDTAILTMPYQKFVVIVWFHKFFNLFFLKQLSCPETIYTKLKETSNGTFPVKFSYIFRTTILRNSFEDLVFFNVLLYFLSKLNF